jgi:hypothetical protein
VPRPRALALAGLGLAALGAMSGCREDPPVERHYPMRSPPAGKHGEPKASAPALEPPDPSATETGAEPGAQLPERPPADPAIDKALDLIATSELRFIDQANDEDSRPSEYTAEQFAAMLRSKWDWIGYDITELEPWLDEIATRSFKTNLPYQVVLSEGRQVDLRPWLDERLAASEDP